jgi:diadenosine tetraphosphatase ApaH/serine/threonine PP2A family protein phosphatase
MRIGIFSDVHANIEAMSAVVEAFKNERIDKYVCIGDTVGYGASPNECCDIIRKLAAYTILGNHDAAVAGRMDYSYYYDAARQALDYHAGILSSDNMEWLKGLPYEVRDEEVTFCHGSPINLEEFEYIFSTEQAARCLEIWDDLNVVTFIGHSHLCKSCALSRDDGVEVGAQKFALRPDHRYNISGGAGGQPRDGGETAQPRGDEFAAGNRSRRARRDGQCRANRARCPCPGGFLTRRRAGGRGDSRFVLVQREVVLVPHIFGRDWRAGCGRVRGGRALHDGDHRADDRGADDLADGGTYHFGDLIRGGSGD